MDAFESLVALLLRREGYWTASSLKVDLTKDQKRAVNRPSSPRWEIDLVAYKGATNELLAVECKSFLDSPGVKFRNGVFEPPERYKLFSEEGLRNVVLQTLAVQLASCGACATAPKVTLCLATGKIASVTDRPAMLALFEGNGWRLFDERWIGQRLAVTADAGYENDIAFVVTKLLRRHAARAAEAADEPE